MPETIARKLIARQGRGLYAVEDDRPVFGVAAGCKRLACRHFNDFQRRLIVATFSQAQSLDDAARDLRESMDPRITARLVAEVVLLTVVRKQPSVEREAATGSVRERMEKVVSIKRRAA